MRKLIILGAFLVAVSCSFWALAEGRLHQDSPKGPPDCINCKVVNPNVSTN